VLGAVDHVGFLARDLKDAVADYSRIFGIEIVRTINRPQFSLIGHYLGETASVEIFSFTDEELLQERLAGADLVFDHVAHVVEDIDLVASELSARGVRFCGPNRREELRDPIDLGGVRHLWTVPETSWGRMIQLIEH